MFEISRSESLILCGSDRFRPLRWIIYPRPSNGQPLGTRAAYYEYSSVTA